jgi:glycosyltransferase involved in cell wall biosynthesis
MFIVMVDDSTPFDGATVVERPVGSMEKALALLATALAGRGHEVRVYNRCAAARQIDGVDWQPLEAAKPASCDVLIAFRRPSLLGAVEQVAQRVLWFGASAALLGGSASRNRLKIHRPVVIFMSRKQQSEWTAHDGLRASTIAPGVAPAYLEKQPMEPADPPVAVVTTHPLLGLDWLLKIWMDRIFQIAPKAALHIYSAVLQQALDGGTVPPVLKAVVQTVRSNSQRNVKVLAPLPDAAMAQAFRAARVHLYPGADEDMLCATLAESQATGLPAVARPLGAVRERVREHQTGSLCATDDAFAQAALKLLNNDDIFKRMSGQAQLMQNKRSWDVAAGEFEAWFKPPPPQ